LAGQNNYIFVTFFDDMIVEQVKASRMIHYLVLNLFDFHQMVSHIQDKCVLGYMSI